MSSGSRRHFTPPTEGGGCTAAPGRQGGGFGLGHRVSDPAQSDPRMGQAGPGPGRGRLPEAARQPARRRGQGSAYHPARREARPEERSHRGADGGKRPRKKSQWGTLNGRWVPHDTRDEIVDYVARWTGRAGLPAGWTAAAGRRRRKGRGLCSPTARLNTGIWTSRT